MVRKADIVFKDNVRGGEGTIEFRHILSADELMGHGTIYAHLIVPPHCSLGFHQHVENTEPYYVLKGKGIFVDMTVPEQRSFRVTFVSSKLVRATQLKIRSMSRLSSWHW